MTHGLRIAFSILLAASLGAAIWALSPRIVGVAEPWDGPFWYYPTSLFMAGAITAALWPSRPGLAPVGVYFGQFVYAFAFLQGGPLWVIGLFAGAFYLPFVIAGAATTYVICNCAARRSSISHS